MFKNNIFVFRTSHKLSHKLSQFLKLFENRKNIFLLLFYEGFYESSKLCENLKIFEVFF